LTDGERTADFAWLRHAGRQVACGIPDDARWHMTYPADGKAHYTVREGAGHSRRFLPKSPLPLVSFRGRHTLLALGLASTTLEDLRPFERRAQDAVAFLDLRSFPDEGVVWIELGLVEAQKADQLQFDFEVQQLLLVTSVTPWVYIAAGSKAGIMSV
jgi:hypothetical protein